ncbi:hypothetical protein RhiXN_03059 [Rhizoctonia solani]|uniref:RGS domain-containing protein n=1 Tax=Rhizoctonia solani TaxID=456999 RepID=A0A8H8NT52_9AGAM|nr:uncharacterized protein RhiXN_03059 [Rhizoctonia solani]QRW18135.1 hypothetical protein RhiXN_03059 [Rhizoctonia solani]
MASFTRPPHYPYSFKALKDVPRRLFNPPRSQIKIGRVRSMSLTPLFEVKLADVLDGQHLPPLSRKDFEEYLLFVEHSPENLYFIQWYRDYTKAYNAWAQTGTPYSPQLALSWSRAKQTFLVNDAHFKLNLSRESLEGLPNSSQQPISSVSMPQESSSQGRPTGLSYPNPIALTKIKSEVEDMLRESLNRFVCGSCGNSGRARGLFGIALGVITLAVGLAPVLVSILQGRGGRALRVAAIPIFWLGAWITIMSLHAIGNDSNAVSTKGVCILIYLAGDSRQLYPYELARPKITAPISKPQPASISYSEDKPRNDIEKSGGATNQVLHVDLEQGHMGSYSSASTLGKHSRHYSTSSMGHGDHQTRGQACELTAMASPQTVASPASVNNLIQQPNAAAGLAAPQRWSFDFDALPSPGPNASADPNQWGSALPTRSDRNFGSIPTFGPLTKVLSPIVTRAQWEIVVRSAIMGVVVAAILGAICLAIPARK